MNRFARPSTTIGMGWFALLPAAVFGQAPSPPAAAAPATGFDKAELSGLAQQMAERVRQLGMEIASEVGNTPRGPELIQDARELSEAIEEFRQAVPGMTDALRARQRYSSIDSSWHYLLVQLGRPEAPSPRLEAESRRVGEVDARIHKALGANTYPAIYYGGQASPGAMPELQRLAHSLVDRAEVMLSLVRADMRGPVGSRIAEEVTSLVQAADAYHDGINLDSRPDDIMRNGFAGVSAASGTIEADLAGIAGQVPVSDRVRNAWRSFRTTETLMRQALKLPVRTAEMRDSVVSNTGRESVRELADRLVRQTDDFIVAFTLQVGEAPEGGYLLADARRLRAVGANFRAEIPRAIDVSQLAGAFRDVDAMWEVLARRANRIAPGQNGPNMQRLEAIWQTVSQIQQMLGMPGFPTAVGPLAGPG